MISKGLSIAFLALAVSAGAVLFLPVHWQSQRPAHAMSTNTIARFDLSSFQDSAPAHALDLLFIHHSCGGQLFASPGPNDGTNCIYTTHPEGGGLRARLQKAGYRVHEASYGSKVGDKTDIFDWLPKFRDQMDAALKCDLQDKSLPEGRRNQVVVFKSCFPNNAFVGEGIPPGNPGEPELTVWNAKAAYAALLDEFKKLPDVLFVCMTAPPLAEKTPAQPLWKVVARRVLGRSTGGSTRASGPLARQFNNWLAAKDGWLNDYPLQNVVVFDFYDILTGNGSSDFSAYPTGRGYDSHPNREGNQKAAEAFVPFLNRAVNRLGVLAER